jgi:hypothetical protein
MKYPQIVRFDATFEESLPHDSVILGAPKNRNRFTVLGWPKDMAHDDRDTTKTSRRTYLKNHQTASALTAVKNGDVYRAGGLYQGPITNLVLTQRTAKQLYGVEEPLYDGQRVADIVAGEF